MCIDVYSNVQRSIPSRMHGNVRVMIITVYVSRASLTHLLIYFFFFLTLWSENPKKHRKLIVLSSIDNKLYIASSDKLAISVLFECVNLANQA